jgi:hydrogenase nickel incorporation protein HypA/HybF
MHEYSLIQTLLDQVCEVAREHQVRFVREIAIAVGPLSGLEPLLLESAFRQLASGEPFGGTKLTVDLVPLTIRCDNCRQTCELTDFMFTCPLCGCEKTRVTGGEAVILRQVVLEQSAAAEATT